MSVVRWIFFTTGNTTGEKLDRQVDKNMNVSRHIN